MKTLLYYFWCGVCLLFWHTPRYELRLPRFEDVPDGGYFYMPYVPKCSVPVVLDPESFCPRKGILTRYGKRHLEEGKKYYARVPISELVT